MEFKIKFSFFAFFFYFCVTLVLAVLNTQPEQVHISFGKSPNEMVVTWVTFDPTSKSTVEYGQAPSKLNKIKFGTVTKFVDGGSSARVLWIHRVLLDDLVPGSEYMYHCGSTDGWSAVYWFTAMQNGTNWSPRLVVYGDLGNYNAQSLPRIQEEVQKGMYDALLHVGDMAYNLDSENATIGDEFMRQIETIAAYLPYQVCVGNHEQAYNFSNYVNRFSMVNQDGEINNNFYSFDLGPAHIIAFSTEFYFYVKYGWIQIARQYEWLENDLKKANLPENRAKRPWIITMGHRPMYCSTNDTDDCKNRESIIRKGLPIAHAYGLEDLFYKYGVDLELWAHEHLYERLWPIYDYKVYNGSLDAPYTNPKAPVHIITGSAGCQENLDPFVDNPAEWSAARFSDYGYTRFNIINNTHLYMEQVSDDQDGIVLDKMLLIKDRHGPDAWL
ncbi:acid phosphatase type 7-like [Parasteatoda tepidariorum]|uniref:acid phosphatase type 7-like n=1 Tax=Parasteatoda tepidariorum TaxID=114398 RepID=UPI001C71D982|nr:acid phosphatase type 7-like [Parasteatoda tepidariorum]